MYQHTRQASEWQPVPSSSSHEDIIRNMNNGVNRAEVVARESETIAQGAMDELAHQREVLGRTRERVAEANSGLDSTNKNLRYIYFRIVTDKLLLCSIILMELIIIGLQIYLKFFKK